MLSSFLYENYLKNCEQKQSGGGLPSYSFITLKLKSLDRKLQQVNPRKTGFQQELEILITQFCCKFLFTFFLLEIKHRVFR